MEERVFNEVVEGSSPCASRTMKRAPAPGARACTPMRGSATLGCAPAPGARKTVPAPGFFCRLAPTRIWHGELPHWEQDGVCSFVTMRLADSLPRERLEDLARLRAAWLAEHPEPRTREDDQAYVRLFAVRVEHWLDAGVGECLLRDTRARQAVEAASAHDDGLRYVLYASVVMPNHVHMLLMPRPGESLRGILRSFKKVTSRSVNEVLGRTGHVWQREYWDTLIRNQEHFDKARRYLVQNNPRLAYDVYRT